MFFNVQYFLWAPRFCEILCVVINLISVLRGSPKKIVNTTTN